MAQNGCLQVPLDPNNSQKKKKKKICLASAARSPIHCGSRRVSTFPVPSDNTVVVWRLSSLSPATLLPDSSHVKVFATWEHLKKIHVACRYAGNPCMLCAHFDTASTWSVWMDCDRLSFLFVLDFHVVISWYRSCTSWMTSCAAGTQNSPSYAIFPPVLFLVKKIFARIKNDNHRIFYTCNRDRSTKWSGRKSCCSALTGFGHVKLAHCCTVFTCPLVVKAAPCNVPLYSEVSHYHLALRTN